VQTILFIFTVCLVVNYAVCNECPKIMDGLTNGRFDLKTQFSSNSISANWNKIDGVIKYEWAIVSKSFYDLSNLNNCRKSAGFSGVPNIQTWRDVSKLNFATNNNLKLKVDETYFVIVRTTFKWRTIL